MERYIVNIICLGLDSEKVRMRARWWGTSAEGFDGMMMMAVVNGITIVVLQVHRNDDAFSGEFIRQ